MSKPTPMLFPMSTGLFSSTAQSSELISTPQARPKEGDPHSQNEALGRSRGGLTTKIHLACDGKGRPLFFSKERYARRNMICINRLNQWRGFATRYEKRAVYFCAAITLISLMIWLN